MRPSLKILAASLFLLFILTGCFDPDVIEVSMRIMGNGQVNEDGTEFCSNASSSGGDTLCQRSYSTGMFGGEVLLSFTAQPGVGWKKVEPIFVDDPLNPDFECLISEGDPEPEDDLAVDTANERGVDLPMVNSETSS